MTLKSAVCIFIFFTVSHSLGWDEGYYICLTLPDLTHCTFKKQVPVYFSCLAERCEAVLLQKCFVCHETSPAFPSAWRWVDSDWIYIFWLNLSFNHIAYGARWWGKLANLLSKWHLRDGISRVKVKSVRLWRPSCAPDLMLQVSW